MKHLIKKVSAARSKIITHFKLGNDSLNVVERDGYVKGILNGYEVFSTMHEKQAGENLGYFLKDLLSTMFVGGAPGQVIIFRKTPQQDPEKSYMTQVMPDLKRCVGPKNIILKKMPVDASDMRSTLVPDFKIEKALNYESLVHNLKVFGGKTASLCRGLSAVRDKATMLTRKKIVASMWGAEKVQGVLDAIREDLQYGDRFGKVELQNQVLQKSIERLAHKMSASGFQNTKEDKRVASEVLIPSVIDSYENLKGVLSHAIGSVTPLVYIDDAFKVHTSYPAKFFLSQDLLDGVHQEYDGLIKFAVQIPKIEEKVIDPLSFIKLKCLSEMVSN